MFSSYQNNKIHKIKNPTTLYKRIFHMINLPRRFIQLLLLGIFLGQISKYFQDLEHNSSCLFSYVKLRLRPYMPLWEIKVGLGKSIPTTFNLKFRKKVREKIFFGGKFFSRGDFSWDGSCNLLQIALNFSRTYEKLHCK